MEDPDRLSRTVDELVLVAVGALVLVDLALGPSVAILLHSGQLRSLGLDHVVSGWVSLVVPGAWADPGSGFGSESRSVMPGAAGFWASQVWVVLMASAVTFALGREIDRRAADARLGRRWWNLEGARPRAWARPRDLAELAGGDAGRMGLGRVRGRRRTLRAYEESHVALLAPTGAGKTSGLVIPWVLEAPGPVISLSVKPDVYDATHASRAERGRVWVWDPFGPRSCGWTPLLGCENWSGALRRAKGLADAGDKDGTSEAAVFWKGEGAKLLAPLLHAAAAHDLAMSDVLRWLDQRDEEQPLSLLQDVVDTSALEAHAIRCSEPDAPQRASSRRRLILVERREQGARSASAQLEAILSLDGRNSGTTYMSAAALLAAYRYPEVQATETRSDLSAQALLDCSGGQANTLYIVAGAEDQELLAPIVVALLTEVMALGARRAADDGPFSPTVRFVGDELTNIAPIRSLPRYLSTLRAPGFRFALVAQNIAQLRAVYGAEDVDTILTNCHAKLFLGPITCTQTIEYLGRILGESSTASLTTARAGAIGESARVSEAQAWRPRASARELQQLGQRRAVLLHGTLPAAVIQTFPWWKSRDLLRMVHASDPSGGSAPNRRNNGVTNAGAVARTTAWKRSRGQG